MLFGDLRNGRLKTCGSGREQKNKKKIQKNGDDIPHPHFHSCVAHLLTNTHSHTRARREMMYSSLSSSSVLAMTNSTTTTKTTPPFASTRRVKAAAQKWAKNTTAAPSWKRSNPLTTTTTTRARANAFEMGVTSGLKRASNFRLNAVDTEAPSSSSSSNKIETPFGTIDLPQLPELPKFELPNAASSSSSSSSSSS